MVSVWDFEKQRPTFTDRFVFMWLTDCCFVVMDMKKSSGEPGKEGKGFNIGGAEKSYYSHWKWSARVRNDDYGKKHGVEDWMEGKKSPVFDTAEECQEWMLKTLRAFYKEEA